MEPTITTGLSLFTTKFRKAVFHRAGAVRHDNAIHLQVRAAG
jgi:hypothetical protein